MLALSSWMEKPAGRRTVCWAMWIAPGVGMILDLAGHSHYAMKTIAVGIIFLAVIIGATFWVGGRSLIGAINESLRQYQQQQQETATALTAATTAATGATGGDRDENEQEEVDVAGGGLVPGEGDQPLLAAKKKIKRMMIFVVQNVVTVMTMLLLTVFTDYGVAAPLLLFMVPGEFFYIFLYAGQFVAPTLEKLATRHSKQASLRIVRGRGGGW